MNRDGDVDFLAADVLYERKPAANSNKFIDGFQSGFGMVLGASIASAIVAACGIGIMLLLGISLD